MFKNSFRLIDILTNSDNEFDLDIKISGPIIEIKFNILHFDVLIYNDPEYDFIVDGSEFKTNDVKLLLGYFGGNIIH